MRWPPPSNPGEVNHSTVDRFTLVHASIGVGYGLLGWEILWVLVLAFGWEIVENPLKAYLPRVFPHATRDTLRNAVGDIVAVLTGWAIVTFLFAV